MASLDTNILVRYLVQDDAAQAATARNFIKRCVAEGQPLFVPVSVSLELEWVLRSRYGFSKGDVIQTMADLLSAVELTLESEHALEVALVLYREGTADYADCMHIALASQANERPLWTFDKKASKVSGARLLMG